MKPYINEDIKNNTHYLNIQGKVRKELKKYTLYKAVYVTIDQDIGGEFTVCLWKELPSSKDASYWEEDIDRSLINETIIVENLTQEEKEYVKENWTRLIWQIKQEGE